MYFVRISEKINYYQQMTVLETELVRGASCIFKYTSGYIHKESKPTFCTIYAFLFLVRSPTCFGQVYWPFSGSHKQ